MWNLISGLKTLRENSVQIFLLAIWSLDVLKRIVKIFPKRLLNKEIKKPRLKFNPGLGLIGLWTTGPWFVTFSKKKTNEKKETSLVNYFFSQDGQELNKLWVDWFRMAQEWKKIKMMDLENLWNKISCI